MEKTLHFSFSKLLYIVCASIMCNFTIIIKFILLKPRKKVLLYRYLILNFKEGEENLETELDLRELFIIVRKRILLILIVTLASTLVSAGVSYFVLKPSYKADISVIIGKPTVDGKTVSYNDVIMYQKLVKTYGELAKSRTVADHVIQSLGLDITPGQLQGMISVAPKGDTEFITMSVTSGDAELSMKIANQLALSLDRIGQEVKQEDNVQLLDEALLPTGPSSPRPLLNMAIAFFLGLMVSVGIVFLLEYIDSTIKSQDDVEKLIGIPVIGIIPLVETEE